MSFGRLTKGFKKTRKIWARGYSEYPRPMPFHSVGMDDIRRNKPKITDVQDLFELRSVLVIEKEAKLSGQYIEALVCLAVEMSGNNIAFRPFHRGDRNRYWSSAPA